MLSNTRWMEVPKIVSAFQMRPAAKDNMVVKDSQAAAAALVAALVSTVISQVANNDSITGVVNATGGVDAKSRVTNSFNVVCYVLSSFLCETLTKCDVGHLTRYKVYGHRTRFCCGH